MRKLKIICEEGMASVSIQDPTGNPKSPVLSVAGGETKEFKIADAHYEQIVDTLESLKEMDLIKYTVSGGPEQSAPSAQPEEVDIFSAPYTSKEKDAWDKYGGVPATFGEALDKLTSLVSKAQDERAKLDKELGILTTAAPKPTTKKKKAEPKPAPEPTKDEEPTE